MKRLLLFTLVFLCIVGAIFAVDGVMQAGLFSSIQDKIITLAIGFVLGIVFSKWLDPLFKKHPELIQGFQDVSLIAEEVAVWLTLKFPKETWDDLLLLGIKEFRRRLPTAPKDEDKVLSIVAKAIIKNPALPNPPTKDGSTI